jgi:hypothetical protein
MAFKGTVSLLYGRHTGIRKSWVRLSRLWMGSMEQGTRGIDSENMLLLVRVVTGVARAWFHLQGPDEGQREGAHVSLAGNFAPGQG